MKLHFLGTISGFWPLPGRKHQSFIIEINDTYYMFDAGGGNGRTAYLMGLDLLKIDKIIISHPHMDHIGGLSTLLWNIERQVVERKTPLKYGDIDLYLAHEESFIGSRALLECAGVFKSENIGVNYHDLSDGVVFEDANMKVTCIHNLHACRPAGDKWCTFSFLIEAEGKRIVYSGDVKSYDELLPLIGDGCDALIGETGHHNYADVCEYLKGRHIKTLFFTHHGRSVVADFSKTALESQQIFDGNVIVCNDSTTFSL